MNMINVVRIENGIIDKITSFTEKNSKLAEIFFANQVKEISDVREISDDIEDEDIEDAIEDGIYDDGNGSEVHIIWSEVVE